MSDKDEAILDWQRRLAVTIEERDALRAEVERLRAGWDESQTFMALALEREERLRAVKDAILTYRQAAADAGNPMWPWPALEIALDACQA